MHTRRRFGNIYISYNTVAYECIKHVWIQFCKFMFPTEKYFRSTLCISISSISSIGSLCRYVYECLGKVSWYYIFTTSNLVKNSYRVLEKFVGHLTNRKILTVFYSHLIRDTFIYIIFLYTHSISMFLNRKYKQILYQR